MTATFLCSLVAGFLFAFAVVSMPGSRSLDDGGPPFVQRSFGNGVVVLRYAVHG
jgi:hypothetical protein